MALALKAVGKLIYNCIDESGTHGRLVIHFPSSQLASVTETNATALAALLQAITGCSVQSYSFGYEAVDDAPPAAVAGSRIEHKGRFLFDLANGGETKVEVPGILQAKVLPDGAINLPDTDVTAFVGALIAGTAFSGGDGSDITAVKAAYEAFRNSTKAMLPSRRFVS